MKLQGIAKLARATDVFRKVLHTGRRLQILILSLRKGEGTREENHPNSDQLLFVLHGDGEALMGGRRHDLDRGDGLFVALGTRLKLRNTGDDELRVMVVISPPAYPESLVQEFRARVIEVDAEDFASDIESPEPEPAPEPATPPAAGPAPVTPPETNP